MGSPLPSPLGAACGHGPVDLSLLCLSTHSEQVLGSRSMIGRNLYDYWPDERGIEDLCHRERGGALKRHRWRSNQADIRGEAQHRKFGAGEEVTLTSLRIEDGANLLSYLCWSLIDHRRVDTSISSEGQDSDSLRTLMGYTDSHQNVPKPYAEPGLTPTHVRHGIDDNLDLVVTKKYKGHWKARAKKEYHYSHNIQQVKNEIQAYHTCNTYLCSSTWQLQTSPPP